MIEFSKYKSNNMLLSDVILLRIIYIYIYIILFIKGFNCFYYGIKLNFKMKFKSYQFTYVSLCVILMLFHA